MSNPSYLPSTWKRCFAFAFDQFVMILLYFPLWGFWYEMMTSDEEVIYVPLSVYAFFLLFPFFYEFIFLFLFQQTPGKWVFGLWVVSPSDPARPLTWVQAFLRALVGRFSLFFSWAPYALVFFTYDRRHLVDWVAETRVLQDTPRARPPKIRWIVGIILVLFYVSEGFEHAMYTWDSIDWDSGRVDLQEAFGENAFDWVNLDFEDED